MHDYIFVVRDALQWHQHNRRLNPSHYAADPWWDRWLQAWGGSIYYLTDVSLPDGRGARLKYGVIELEAFLGDLWQWRQLYVAGRLHKPTLSLCPVRAEIAAAIQANRRQALRTALLTLPERFTGRTLLTHIVSLSYWGDPRMIWAEDPQKIARIVAGQGSSLWELYRPYLVKQGETEGPTTVHPDPYGVNDNTITGITSTHVPASHDPLDALIEQDTSPLGRLCELTKLPETLRERLVRQQGSLYALIRDDPHPLPLILPRAVKRAVASLVRPASIVQPVKGFLTAGLGKSLAYGIHKIKRRLL